MPITPTRALYLAGMALAVPYLLISFAPTASGLAVNVAVFAYSLITPGAAIVAWLPLRTNEWRAGLVVPVSAGAQLLVGFLAFAVAHGNTLPLLQLLAAASFVSLAFAFHEDPPPTGPRAA